MAADAGTQKCDWELRWRRDGEQSQWEREMSFGQQRLSCSDTVDDERGLHTPFRTMRRFLCTKILSHQIEETCSLNVVERFAKRTVGYILWKLTARIRDMLVRRAWTFAVRSTLMTEFTSTSRGCSSFHVSKALMAPKTDRTSSRFLWHGSWSKYSSSSVFG